MQALRRSSLLIRCVLTWFVLALGAAVASPLVHPQTMQLVCSAQGSAKLIVVGEDGKAAGAAHHTLDCALCLAVTPPPPTARVSVQSEQPLAYALQPAVAAHIAALIGAPLPARGPPHSV